MENPNFIIKRIRVNGRWVTIITRRPPILMDQAMPFIKKSSVPVFMAADGIFLTRDGARIIVKS